MNTPIGFARVVRGRRGKSGCAWRSSPARGLADALLQVPVEVEHGLDLVAPCGRPGCRSSRRPPRPPPGSPRSAGSAALRPATRSVAPAAPPAARAAPGAVPSSRRASFAQWHAAGVHRFGGGTRRARVSAVPSTRRFFLGPALLQGGQALALLGQRVSALRLRSAVATPMALSRRMIASSVSSASMRRRLSSTSAGTACRLMAVRAQAVSSRLTDLSGSWRAGMWQCDSRTAAQRLVEDLHLVVLLHGRRDTAHHQDGLVLGRLVHLHHLETPGQRRVLLDVLLVLGPGGPPRCAGCRAPGPA